MWKTLLFVDRMAALGVDEARFLIFSSYPGAETFLSLRNQGEIESNDAYFLSLVPSNDKSSMLNPQGVTNPNLSATELAFLRLSFMLLNYGLGYLLHPGCSFHTARNALGNKGSAAVLENRLRDMLHKNKVKPGKEKTAQAELATAE